MGVSPSLRAWVRGLLDEPAASTPAEPPSPVEVFQRLRSHLSRLIGPDGFIALQKRALLLARAELPSLQGISITPEGDLEGLGPSADDAEAAITVTAHMLELLMNLIGEPLTWRVLHQAFPDARGTLIGEPQDS